MKKLLPLFFFLFSISFAAKSQKEDYIWRVGSNGGINFHHAPADTFKVNKRTVLFDTNAGICDSIGNLLFYTNGVNIFNRNSDVMLNGNGLNPTEMTNIWSVGGGGLPIDGADIIIKRPGHSSQYYLFHQTIDNDSSFSVNFFLSNLLYLTTVDMSLDSGRGAVTNKNFHLYGNDTLFIGGLVVVRHANGRDWWLITKKMFAPKFYTWLILPDTIKGPFVQPQPVSPPGTNGFSQSAISPQGNKYASIDTYMHFYYYNFERCTGELSYVFDTQVSTNANEDGTGCAFSSSGRYVYVATRQHIYQFDTWAANIASSKILVAVFDGYKGNCGGSGSGFTQMKLAPDNQIYISTDNGCDVLHTIEYPDSAGLSCEVRQHSIHFDELAINVVSVPNIPDYRLGALEGSPCDSILTEVTTNGKYVVNPDVEFYPNPLTSSSTLQLTTRLKNAEVVIYDMLGKEMVRKKLTGDRMEIERGNLESGVYFVRVRSEERQSARTPSEWVEKVVVQ